MSDCYLCRKPLHGDSSSVDIKRWDPRRNVFFDETRRAPAPNASDVGTDTNPDVPKPDVLRPASCLTNG